MRRTAISVVTVTLVAVASHAGFARVQSPRPDARFDVRAFGAKGDGKALDTDAVNRAIEAASKVGGGTVLFPAGTYLSTSISNCVFDYSRGLAIESVDGGPIEDVAITNLTMRDVVNAPIFVRLGNRARGPANPKGVNDFVLRNAPGLKDVRRERVEREGF